MANHDIAYEGYSTLQGPNADHGDTVRVKNESSVTVTVFWPSGCFYPAPPSPTEEVDPSEYSDTYTISQSAQAGDYPVKIEPPPPPSFVDELPETAVPNIHVNG